MKKRVFKERGQLCVWIESDAESLLFSGQDLAGAFGPTNTSSGSGSMRRTSRKSSRHSALRPMQMSRRCFWRTGMKSSESAN